MRGYFWSNDFDQRSQKVLVETMSDAIASIKEAAGLLNEAAKNPIYDAVDFSGQYSPYQPNPRFRPVEYNQQNLPVLEVLGALGCIVTLVFLFRRDQRESRRENREDMCSLIATMQKSSS